MNLKIPVRFASKAKSQGITHDLSPTGLRFISDTELSLATPMTMQFSFGGETCYVQVVGRWYFVENLATMTHVNYEIGIKFSAIREWEQRILDSVVQVLREDSETRDKSFLTIQMSEDILAREAANLSAEALAAHPEEPIEGIKRGKKLTPHPAWILELRQHIEPAWNAVLNCRLHSGSVSWNAFVTANAGLATSTLSIH